MLLLGLEHLARLVEGESFSAKMVFNARGAIFFPVRQEHRDMKAEGISYEDNYKGNAMAAMLGPGRIEIRYHQGFKDRQVAEIVRRLLARAELEGMRGWVVMYQGRVLAV